MICCRCRNPSSMTKSGICRQCKAAINARPRRKQRPKQTAWRWIDDRYREVFLRSGMTRLEAVAKAQRCYDEMCLLFSRRTVLHNGLDNPYMSDDARQVLVNDLYRDVCLRPRTPRPVAIGFTTATLRKEAA